MNDAERMTILAREHSRRGIASDRVIALHDLNSGDVKRPYRLAGPGVQSPVPTRRRVSRTTRVQVLRVGIAGGYIK